MESFDSRRWSGLTPDDSTTSTELAHTYGLKGEWAMSGGLGAFESFAGQDCLVSRLTAGDVGLSEDDPRTIPAVRGVTAWPPTHSSKVVASFPNLIGVMEPLDRLPDHSSLGAVIYPDLAGALSLPASTGVVVLMIGPQAVSLCPGEDSSLTGSAASLCHRNDATRHAMAALATERAQLLAKHVTQISGVEVVGRVPSTGRLVLVTPAPPRAVLDEMQRLGIEGGRPVGLPEYPGAIAVDCHPDHHDSALTTFAAALGTALERTRSIEWTDR